MPRSGEKTIVNRTDSNSSSKKCRYRNSSYHAPAVATLAKKQINFQFVFEKYHSWLGFPSTFERIERVECTITHYINVHTLLMSFKIKYLRNYLTRYASVTNRCIFRQSKKSIQIEFGQVLPKQFKIELKPLSPMLCGCSSLFLNQC